MRMTTAHHRWVRACLCAAFLGSAATPVSAAIWNIDPSGTGDAPTIQAAFDLAVSGDVIILAPGTYTDSHVRSTFLGSATAVAFGKGGVALESSGGAEVTFIDGQNHQGLVCLDGGAVSIRGITFRDCRTLGDSPIGKWGGGVLATGSPVIIEECRFVDCLAWNHGGGGGGGVFLYGASNADVRYNLFLRCEATDIGGGLEVFESTNVAIENNTFVGNRASRGGGALLLNATSSYVRKNVFAGNTAGTTAGAVWCLGLHVELAECNIFWENSAPGAPHVAICNVNIGSDNNLIADPLFCDAALDDYTILSTSPARPDSPLGCGLIGAYGVACGPVSVEASTWGSVKALYR